MSARRLLAAALVAIWLLPIALAGGVALHVAFDHGHGDGHSRSADQAPPHARHLPQLLIHGHLHDEDADAHGHDFGPASEASRRDVRSVSAPPISVALEAPSGVSASASPGQAAPAVPPPQLAGSALLALLSTLRI